ncbi:MAG TPA: NAD-dependent epimerase/dehydratase family protein [Verrucomicrobiae bacterium]|nr:NAD-dependent epimerase/dehydratase family protein [Verrucomicrobiae bacterium]
MKVLITGICGFVGSVLSNELRARCEGLEIIGLDNLSRLGSELNRRILHASAHLLHGDVRNPSDLETLPKVDWVIDAAANPSVLAGIGAETSSRQLMEHNLVGTINVLEYCKRHKAGLVMLSTSRVYSQSELASLAVTVTDSAFSPTSDACKIPGVTREGVSEGFSTQPPLSLYGSAKLASEFLALEYSKAFDFPVHVNRCGVMAGAGQFGKADQGIYSFWIHSYCRRLPLKYIGFNGTGYQVRDCLHPRDLAQLVASQLKQPEKGGGVLNVSGGVANSISLAKLSQWCAGRFGQHQVKSEPANRPYDVPWLVLDSSRAQREWGWTPATPMESILEEIARHAVDHPDWLDICAGS